MKSPLKIVASLLWFTFAVMFLIGVAGRTEVIALGFVSLAAASIAWFGIHRAENGVLINSESNLLQR